MSEIGEGIARLKVLAREEQDRKELLLLRMDRCERLMLALATVACGDRLSPREFDAAISTIREIRNDLMGEIQ